MDTNYKAHTVPSSHSLNGIFGLPEYEVGHFTSPASGLLALIISYGKELCDFLRGSTDAKNKT
jgi:hypothetical protein